MRVLRPGDILVLELPADTTGQHADAVTRAAHAAIPGRFVVVVGGTEVRHRRDPLGWLWRLFDR
jgi:hypothetical protein